jgi:pimeloyl-ACP methyl ester carboxylesterase
MARLARSLAVILLLLPVSFAGLPLPENPNDSASETSTFEWSSIKPTQELTYLACFGSFQCARLLVPLDWQASEASRYNKTAALAIIKRPAKVSILDPTYGGAIITNPGGPGGSGVQQVLGAGEFLQWAVDSESKHFDIVSFDPRGVLNSGPDADCFSDPLQRDLWNLKTHEEGNLDSGDRALGLQWARAKAFGSLCANAEIGKYIGTASVVRDVLEIVDRVEEHYQTSRLKMESRLGPASTEAQSRLLNMEHPDVGTPMLQYLGFSYGTFLGNTFASMFPDRVKRMVLDGVVDAADYTAQGWTTNLQDTDKVMQAFYKYCFDAAYRCPLYDRAGPEAIERKMIGFLKAVQQNPIVAVDDSGSLPPDIITYSDIKRSIFASLYSPVRFFPALASMLDQLQKGQYDQTLRLLALQTSIHCPRDKTSTSPLSPTENEAPKAIMCGDGDDMSNQTIPEFEEYLDLLEYQSSAAGAIWATFRLICTGWQVRSRWRFIGPFGGNTSTPILWIGNTADPVTPIRNAHNMAKSFPGSVVLQQDSEGHCSLYNAPSNCTFDAIRRYFSSGALPKAGTVCPADRKPFDGKLSTNPEHCDAADSQNAHASDSFKMPYWRKLPLEI